MIACRSHGNVRICFNPRAPGGARFCSFSQKPVEQTVSIHAPPEGRDQTH